MSIVGWVTGNTPGARNNQKRQTEDAKYRNEKEGWRFTERQRRDQYNFQVDQQKAQIANNEAKLRFDEEELQRRYEFNEEQRKYRENAERRAFDKSLATKIGNDTFAEIAKRVANQQQDVYRDEQLQQTAFDHTASVLSYMEATSGIKQDRRQLFLDQKSKSAELRLNRDNAVTEAKFQGSQATHKYRTGKGKADITRRTWRGTSQVKANNAILAGMKAAGKARVSGGSGRSAAKALQGVVAETGARQAAIANELMFAEQGIDLDIAALKDQLIIDQTMVEFAKDRAENSFLWGEATLAANTDLKNIGLMVKRSFTDRKFDLDQQKISKTRESIGKRNAVVRDKIQMQYEQTLRDNEARLMLEPEAYPAFDNPQDYLKRYNEEGEEIGWGLPRPEYPEIPEYRESPEPVKIKGSRESTGFGATVGQILTGAGEVAQVLTGVSALPNVSFGAGMSNLTNILGGAGNFGDILSGQKPSYKPMTIAESVGNLTKNSGNQTIDFDYNSVIGSGFNTDIFRTNLDWSGQQVWGGY